MIRASRTLALPFALAIAGCRDEPPSAPAPQGADIQTCRNASPADPVFDPACLQTRDIAEDCGSLDGNGYGDLHIIDRGWQQYDKASAATQDFVRRMLGMTEDDVKLAKLELLIALSLDKSIQDVREEKYKQDIMDAQEHFASPPPPMPYIP